MYKLLSKGESIKDLLDSKDEENRLFKAIKILNDNGVISEEYQNNKSENCFYKENCKCKDCECLMMFSLTEIPLEINIDEKLILIPFKIS